MRCYSYHLKQSIQKWPGHPRTSNWVKPVGSGLCRSQRRPKVLLSPWGSPVLSTGRATHRRIWVKAHAPLRKHQQVFQKKNGEGRDTPSSWPLARPSQRVCPIPTAHSNPDDRLSDLGFSVRTPQTIRTKIRSGSQRCASRGVAKVRRRETPVRYCILESVSCKLTCSVFVRLQYYSSFHINSNSVLQHTRAEFRDQPSADLPRLIYFSEYIFRN